MCLSDFLASGFASWWTAHPWSHLSIGCSSRTVMAVLGVWQILIWSSCFWGSPMIYILWWTLCIHSGEVLLTLKHIPTSWRVLLIWPAVVKGFFLLSSTTVVFRDLPGLLVLLSSPVYSFFLGMFRTVVLATPYVAISPMGLFWFFSLMMACITDSDSSLDLILGITYSKCKWHTWNQLQTFYLLNWWWHNEEIAHTCPWNNFWVNCPITFGPLKSGKHI